MNKRREDDSRPSTGALSQRATMRDVPAAKYKEGSVGTVAPRGLRGPSLLPGQGAPERINPDDVELAVLRDAETLDGPHVARAAAGKRAPTESRSPSPTAVSVEVPRARSMPPAPGEYGSTPPSPSARSIQSGTLMSIGSVDPRAPTELSLPSPRPMSLSERAAYLGPEAVVDRSPAASVSRPPGASRPPAQSRPPMPSRRPVPLDSPRAGNVTEGSGTPSGDAPPLSSSREVSSSSGAVSSARPSLKADSVSPPAQNFARAPRSYSPVSATPIKPPRPTPMKPPRPEPKSTPPAPPESVRPEALASAPPVSSAMPSAAPRFQIHSDLDAVPHEVQDDAFDLRSVSTQREPLASRKALSSSDWTPHGPVSVTVEAERSVRSSRSSSTAVTILVDRGRDGAPPISERPPPQRAAVPLSWVLGAAAFAVILALIVAFALRPGAPPQAAVPLDERAPAVAPPSTAESTPRDPVAPTPAQGAKRPGSAPSRPSKSKVSPASSPSASASASAAPQSSADPNSKVHQSIY